MGRPPKTGLDYYKRYLNYYDDGRILDLLESYGPLGQTIYDIIITLVYKNGYYLEVSLDTLASLIVRTIGNRWVKKSLVLQVIHFCADIDLIDKDLLSQNVITSAEIQMNYSEVTARNKVDKSKHWLLKKENEPTALLSAPEKTVSVTETPVSAAKTSVSAAFMQQSRLDKIRSDKSSTYEPKSDAETESLGEHGNVKLTTQQHSELIDKYGEKAIGTYIDRLDRYIHNKGVKPYGNHYSTLIAWLEQDKVKKPSEHRKKDIPSAPSFDLEAIFEHAKNNPPVLRNGERKERKT